MELQEIVNRSISERYTYPDIFIDNIGLDSIIPGKPLQVIIYILTINILFLLNNKYNCNSKMYRNLKRSNFRLEL